MHEWYSESLLKKKELEEIIILFLYSLFLMSTVLMYSSLVINAQKFRLLCAVGMATITLISCQWNYYQLEWFIVGSLGAGISILSAPDLSKDFFIIVLIAFSFSNISLKKVVNVSLASVGSFLVILVILSYFGKIPNLIFYRDGAIRYSFGMQYPLTFAGYMFYLCILISLKVKKKFIKVWLFLLVITSYFIIKFTGARNDAVGILLIGLAIIFGRKNYFKKYRAFVLEIATYLLIAFSMFITILIPYTSKNYWVLNKVLSNRLQLQYELFQRYTPHFWGQYIFQQGYGGQVGVINNYFFIDNAYLKLLFMGGILFFIFFVLTILWRLGTLIKYKNWLLFLLFIIALMNGIIEDSLIKPGLDLLIPLFIMSRKDLNEERRKG